MALSIVPGSAPTFQRTIPAAAAARANLEANLRALGRTQPRVRPAVEGASTQLTPAYARDGSLTALCPDGRWWHDCSVPLRAAEAMLARLDLKGRVACILSPTLAAHVRVALAKLRPDQALVAVCPDAEDVPAMLECHDFSADVGTRRLWFAWGAAWGEELRRLLTEESGLATPAQFVRLPVTAAEEVERIVPVAQQVFAEVNADRSRLAASRLGAWRRPATPRQRLCVIAPSHFRLWDDAGWVVGEVLGAEAKRVGRADVVPFDADGPACSSGLALLDRARDCHAICAADTSRADLPGIIPDDMPWVTWVTRPSAIPAFAAAGTADALVLADPAWARHAKRAGWPNDRLSLGGWPVAAATAVPAPPVLGVVADARPIAMPESLAEFSSHELLWKEIAAEMAADPFVLRDGPAAYLERRMKRLGVTPEGLDAAVFLDGLIFPSYAQAVARLLLREGLPIRFFGRGWGELEAFRHDAAGPVASHDQFLQIRNEIAAVIDVSASPGNEPLHRLGRPVARADNLRELIARARRALVGGATPTSPGAPLSLETVLAHVRR